MPLMEFHISREARDRFGVDQTLFSFSGNVIFADLAASRQLALRMNKVRGTENDPKRVIQPGALFAMGLIDEASHLLVAFYREQIDRQVMQDALGWFEQRLGVEAVTRTLLTFVQEFPGTVVYRGEQTPETWLAGATDGVAHREIALEELILLWLSNANSAFRPFAELFDEQQLKQQSAYLQITKGLREFFATKPPVGPEKLNLIDMLRAPALQRPDSLSDQLAFIRERWSAVVGGAALRRLLLAIDVLKEEDVAIWMRFHPPSEAEARARGRHGNPFQSGGRIDLPNFATEQHEYERFSPDQDWMPTTVLIAKSTYVWLAQLSKRYGRHIARLDQIPDEELALLAHRGLNSLWLIGLWERSRASRIIKRLCGKEDAVASAYSLYNYTIAEDLGGHQAYTHLRDRAAAHGLRLASDMVPNHMGIDSTWVIEHPEWFLSRPDAPFPAYSFEGPDLSGDDRVEIKIEDHYYEQSDAAVVFRRRDKWTGDTRFVYHGNDGTSFPWNDTAQLDYLNPAVREQVIQTILQVARNFPIIRFDAAMTLAKRHIQRLWYPAPGAGGAIPSRAEYSMPTSEFDAHIPVEFWREVVDRVAAEVPGTLLLAEAFWMMEGYFVRTLGMHRVYNSAFMVLLRDEDNAHYRGLLKQTMEFDPGIMKRYVNFMSNPDERTAIDQFGTGDKYFGVATLMATLPGLPMFGHGQVEGFTEKYGMEYQRPRFDETPNQWLVDRHQREIAPLLYQRALFAESDNFVLYDFWKEDGTVDENVYAYSNRRGDQRALVLYHNRYSTTRGTVHHSTGIADKQAGGIRQRSLGDALQLPTDGSLFLGYRDVSTGLEFLRRSSDLLHHGFSVVLHEYSYHVLLNWRELRADAEHPWDRLHDALNGSGVPSLDEALIHLELQPVHEALRSLLEPSLVRRFADLAASSTAVPTIAMGSVSAGMLNGDRTPANPDDILQTFVRRGLAFAKEAETWIATRGGAAASFRSGATRPLIEASLKNALGLLKLDSASGPEWPAEARAVLPSQAPRGSATALWGPVLAWSLLHTVLAGDAPDTPTLQDAAAELERKRPAAGLAGLFDTLHLRRALAQGFAVLGMEAEDGWRAAARIRTLLHRASGGRTSGYTLTAAEWRDGDLRWLTGVHDAAGQTYFNKEQHEELLWWLQLPTLLALTEEAVPDSHALSSIRREIEDASSRAGAAGYELNALLKQVEAAPVSTTPMVLSTSSAVKKAKAKRISVKGKSAPGKSVQAAAESLPSGSAAQPPSAAKKAAKAPAKAPQIPKTPAKSKRATETVSEAAAEAKNQTTSSTQRESESTAVTAKAHHKPNKHKRTPK